MILNCLITGVGGQGTVLMSRLIGTAALEKGLEVRGTETIGMAQRGGSVVSHIRMGREIHSPLIPLKKADLIIAFEPAEALRVLPFLAESGRMLVLNRPVKPVSSLVGGPPYDAGLILGRLREHLGGVPASGEKFGTGGGAFAGARLAVIGGEELLAKCGSPKVINAALLGAALKWNIFPFSAEDLRQVLIQKIPERFLALNLKALEIGLAEQD